MTAPTANAKRPFVLLLALLITLLVIFAYLMVRTALFVATEYAWYERVIAGCLLLSETFLLVHGFG